MPGNGYAAPGLHTSRSKFWVRQNESILARLTPREESHHSFQVLGGRGVSRELGLLLSATGFPLHRAA